MISPIPIEAFGAGLLPNVPELVAVLYAYIDETGLNPQAKSVTVAGLVAPLQQWMQIQARWSKRMRATGIDTFHAQPCRGGHKDFKGMSEPDRNQLYEDLAQIASESQPQPVAGSVSKSAWDGAEKTEVFADRYPSHYSFCFDLCLTAINRIAEEEGRRVIVIYAVNEQYLPRAQQVAQVYEASQRYLKWIAGCIPNTPAAVVPLQVADMLAYEVYHHHQNASTRPPSDLLARLQYPFLGYEYGSAELRTLIEAGPIGNVE